MTLYKGKYRVESTRLPDWDYASSGWYFVTICTKDRVCFFGEIVSGTMHRPESGEIAHRRWEEIPQRYAHVVLDAFVVMPNHIHGIIEICDDLRKTCLHVETRHGASLQDGSVHCNGALYPPSSTITKEPSPKRYGVQGAQISPGNRVFTNTSFAMKNLFMPFGVIFSIILPDGMKTI